MKPSNTNQAHHNAPLVAYVGPFSFPNGGAAARRIIGIAKSLISAGFDVTVASGQDDRNAPEGTSYEGVEVTSLNERTAEHLPRVLKHLAYITMGKKTVAWLDSLPYPPAAVILYSGYSPYLIQLNRWSRRTGVPIIFDAVEWYDPATVFGWLYPYQLNIELAMRLLAPKASGAISISNYLHRHFIKNQCPSIRIPPTLDVKLAKAKIEPSKQENSVRLAYSGTPGRKDLLNETLEAVLQLHEAGCKIHLSVAGVSENEGKDFPAIRGRSKDAHVGCVSFFGVLSHSDSLEMVRSADFTVLLRNDARYSRAGFPTKFVESMAVGTPVISNLTSDLDQYLTDELTGFVCNEVSPVALATAIRKAIAQSPINHGAMRTRCRDVALRAFDFRTYSAQLASFMHSLKA